MKALRLILQIALPVLLLAIGATVAFQIANRPAAATPEPPAFVGPLVRSLAVTIEDVRIDVPARGVVEARRRIDLAPQVGGEVIEVGPGLRAGGFFTPGDVLLRIDPSDYELAVVQQEAAVAQAGLRLQLERAEAEAAITAWRKLNGNEPADDLVMRKPQIADAETALAAAEAMLDRARLDLARTTVKAPFHGRVRTADVDLGQVVAPRAPVAQIYGIDTAEVRLPLAASDVAFVDLPMGWQESGSNRTGPTVTLTADFAGQRHEYRGVITRTEGEIDRRTRQLTVVVQVDDPYGRKGDGSRPPLTLGMFVEATITGRTFEDVAVIPRGALRGENEVWLIDAENRLQRREVEVLRVDPERVYVRTGLQKDEVVCVTPLEAPVVGMPVRLVEEPGR